MIYYLRQTDRVYRRTDGKPLTQDLPDETLTPDGWQKRLFTDPHELPELSVITEADARRWAKELRLYTKW